MTGKQRRYWLGGLRSPAQDRFFTEVLDAYGWQPGSERDYTAAWYTGMPEPEVFSSLRADQTVNHIPGNHQLTVKSQLPKTLERAAQRWANLSTNVESADRFAFWPASFVMPEDYAALQAAFHACPDAAWIVKPANGARGEGISLIDQIEQAPRESGWVVQRYLDRPHTLGGYKYVLRLYVLIDSLEPLRIKRFAEGSVKLASALWDAAERDNPYAYLTNPDVNAQNPDAPVVFQSLASYRKQLLAHGHDVDALFARIDDLIVLSVLSACEGMRQRCATTDVASGSVYELLGLDCLVDADLKPWLLECNLSPSLDVCADPDTGGQQETRMKRALVTELIRQVGIQSDVLSDGVGYTYSCLYPGGDAMRYAAFLPAPTWADGQAIAAATGVNWAPRYSAWQVDEQFDDGALTLHHPGSGAVFKPNPTAAWIWLQAMQGLDADAIAETLKTTAEFAEHEQEDSLRATVWATLAEWSRAGLIRQCTADAKY